jgi:hypothetical protein
MPTHDFKNIGDVLDFELLRGTIKTVDSATDTCTVDVDGSTVDALIFYHCKPDSIARASGAIEGAAAGFKVGDEVIVLKKYDGSAIKVIAHTDGVRHCGKYVVVIVYSTRAKKSVMVWDVEENCVADSKVGFASPVDYDDPIFTAWFAGQTFDPASTSLFDSKTYRLRFELDLNPRYWDGIYYKSLPTVFPEINPGEIDWASYSLETDKISYHITCYGVSHDGTWESYAAWAYPATVLCKRGTENFWFQAFMEGVGGNGNERTYSFYTPFGLMATETAWLHYDSYEEGRLHFYGLDRIYFKSPRWGSSNTIASVKGANAFAHITLLHYTKCETTYRYQNGVYSDVVRTPDAARTCHVHANVIYKQDGYLDTDIVPEGRGLDFESKIKDTVEKYYDVNGLGLNAIDEIVLMIKITN